MGVNEQILREESAAFSDASEAFEDSAKAMGAKITRLTKSNAQLRERLKNGYFGPDWIESTTELPDADSTVLVGWHPDVIALEQQPNEPVWMGYFDGQIWRSVDAGALDPEPTHWMNLPDPPSP